MKAKPREIPDDEDGNPFESIANLLKYPRKVSIGLYAVSCGT